MEKFKNFAGSKLEQFGILKATKKQDEPEQQHPPPQQNQAQPPNPPPENEEQAQPAAVPQQDEPTEPQNEEVIPKIDIMESPLYSLPAFIDALNEKIEERGDTLEEQKYWSYPRRWMFTISNLSIENYSNDPLTCFLEFKIGCTRTECRVKSDTNSQIRILHKGENKISVRTPVVDNITTSSRHFNFNYTSEYRGSYLDLEVEKFKVRLWKYSRTSLNVLEGVFEEPLLKIVNGHINRNINLMANNTPRAKLTFSLSFQELYDFELSFISWSAQNIFSYASLMELAAKKGILFFNESNVTEKNVQKPKLLKKSKSLPTPPPPKKPSVFARFSAFFSKPPPVKTPLATPKEKPPAAKEEESTTYSDSDDEDESANYIKETAKKLALELNKRRFTILQKLKELKSSHRSIFQLEVKLKLNGVDIGNSIKSLDSKFNGTDYLWENLGELYFRGTRSELELCSIHLTVIDIKGKKKKDSVASCYIPLKGILDYPTILKDLSPSPWLTSQSDSENWSNSLKNIDFGSIRGRIQVCNIPRYKQRSDSNPIIFHESAKNGASLYLIASIALDQIAADEKNILKLISSKLGRRSNSNFTAHLFVELYWIGAYSTHKFDFLLRNSSTASDAVKISNCELAIGISEEMVKKIADPSHFNIPPIRIDLYASTYLDDSIGDHSSTNQLAARIVHLGGNSIMPSNIFYNNKGLLRQKINKTHSLDLVLTPPSHFKKGKMYETRGVAEKLPLLTPWDNSSEGISSIQLSLWTYPGVQTHLPERRLDYNQSAKAQFTETGLNHCYNGFYTQCKESWESVIKSANLLSLPLEQKNQNGSPVFIQSLLIPITPPPSLDNPNSIFQFVLSIPFRKPKQNLEYIQTPYFTLKQRSGSMIDHTILFACLLLGLSHKYNPSLLIVSTNKDRETINLYECSRVHVSFPNDFFVFDMANGTKLNSRSRMFNLNPTYIITYKNIYLVTDDRKQKNLSDIIEESYSFFPRFENGSSLFDFRGFASTIRNFNFDVFSSTLSQLDIESASKILESRLEAAVNSHRTTQNLQTRWNKDTILSEYLAKGIKLLFQVKSSVSEIEKIGKAEFNEWKQTLCSKVPPSHRISVRSFSFLDTNISLIMDTLKTNVSEYLDSRDDNISFSQCIIVFPLPSSLIVIYLMFLVSVKIHERDRRKLECQNRKHLRLLKKASSVTDGQLSTMTSTLSSTMLTEGYDDETARTTTLDELNTPDITIPEHTGSLSLANEPVVEAVYDKREAGGTPAPSCPSLSPDSTDRTDALDKTPTEHMTQEATLDKDQAEDIPRGEGAHHEARDKNEDEDKEIEVDGKPTTKEDVVKDKHRRRSSSSHHKRKSTSKPRHSKSHHRSSKSEAKEEIESMNIPTDDLNLTDHDIYDFATDDMDFGTDKESGVTIEQTKDEDHGEKTADSPKQKGAPEPEPQPEDFIPISDQGSFSLNDFLTYEEPKPKPEDVPLDKSTDISNEEIDLLAHDIVERINAIDEEEGKKDVGEVHPKEREPIFPAGGPPEPSYEDVKEKHRRSSSSHHRSSSSRHSKSRHRSKSKRREEATTEAVPSRPEKTEETGDKTHRRRSSSSHHRSKSKHRSSKSEAKEEIDLLAHDIVEYIDKKPDTVVHPEEREATLKRKGLPHPPLKAEAEDVEAEPKTHRQRSSHHGSSTHRSKSRRSSSRHHDKPKEEDKDKDKDPDSKERRRSSSSHHRSKSKHRGSSSRHRSRKSTDQCDKDADIDLLAHDIVERLDSKDDKGHTQRRRSSSSHHRSSSSRHSKSRHRGSSSHHRDKKKEKEEPKQETDAITSLFENFKSSLPSIFS